MKRILILLLVFILAFSLTACGDKKNEEKKDDSDNGGKITMIDYNNPLVDADAAHFGGMSIDGHLNSYAVPRLNVSLDGAEEINSEILEWFNQEYSEYFDEISEMLKTGETPKQAVLVDYSYHVDYDTVAVIVTTEEYEAGITEKNVHVWYYDALSDSELSMVDYLSYCSISVRQIMEKLASTDYYKSAVESGKEVTEHDIQFVALDDEGKMNVYLEHCSTGDIVCVTVDVESEQLDTSALINQ